MKRDWYKDAGSAGMRKVLRKLRIGLVESAVEKRQRWRSCILWREDGMKHRVGSDALWFMLIILFFGWYLYMCWAAS